MKLRILSKIGLILSLPVVQGGTFIGKPIIVAFMFLNDPASNNNADNASSASGVSNAIATRHENVFLPHREYGYRSEPLTWEELVDIIAKENNLARLSRSVQQETEYTIYREKLKSEWKSVYDHILHTKFGFEKREARNRDAEYFWEAYPPMTEIKEERTTLVLNDFPYYNAPNIYHYVLWKIGGDVTDQEIEDARNELHSSLGDVKDLLHWKNPPHLKSLPDIDHIHILCLRKPSVI